MLSRPARLLLGLTVALIGLDSAAPPAPGQIKEFTWAPGTSGFDWKSSGNWSGPSGYFPDDPEDKAIFGVKGSTADPSLDGDLPDLGQLVFNAAGWTVWDSGSETMNFNSLTNFNHNAIYSSGSGTNRIKPAVAFLQSGQNVYTGMGNTLAFEKLAGSYAFIVSSTNPTSADTGAIRLEGNNSSLTNAFLVRQGTLLVAHNGALGSGAGTIYFADDYTASGANARLLTDAANVTVSKNLDVRNLPGHEVNATIGGNQAGGNSTFSGTVALGRSANLTSANSGSAVEFSNTISGPGGIAKTGYGTVVLSHANAYAGATSVERGVLNIRSGTALGGAANGTSVADGAALEIQGNITVAGETLGLTGHGFSLGPQGALRNTSGDNRWTGAIALNYNTTIQSDAGNLNLDTSVTSAGWNLALHGNGNGQITGPVTLASGGLSKAGSGTWTLSSANQYTGETSITAGTLAYGADNVIGSGAVTISGASAVLALGSYSDTVGTVTLDGGGQITGLGTLTSTSGFALNNGSASASLAGSVGLNKTTAGTVTLSGANTFTGDTRIMAGTLKLGNGWALQQSTVDLAAGDSGTLDLGKLDAALGGLKGSRDLAIPTDRVLSVGNNNASTTYGGSLSGTGAGLKKVGTGTLTLTGASDYSGATVIAAGRLQLGNGATSGSIAGSTVANQGTLIFNRADKVLFDASISGTGTVVHAGAGKTILTADHSYQGPTAVQAGTLQIDGQYTGGGLFSVQSGATLGGKGSIVGDVFVDTDALLTPGASIESLEIFGDVRLLGSLVIEADGAGSGAIDLLAVSGDLDLSQGAVDFDFDVSQPLDDPVYIFARYGSLSGDAFAEVLDLPDGYWIDYHYGGADQIALVQAVPEPAAWAIWSTGIFLVGLSGWIRRRRRA